MQTTNLLVIEDNKADIIILNRSLAKSSLDLDIKEVYDGEEAMYFLDGLLRSKSEDKYWPDLVLLDLNLPKIDGYQVLKKIKSNDDLCSIPVFIYSSSEVDELFLKSNKIKLEGALKKPRSLSEVSTFVDQLETFLKSKNGNKKSLVLK